MTRETYYIPADANGLACVGHLASCGNCGKKTIVILPFVGTPNHMNPHVCCLECMAVDSKFRNKHPDIAEKIDQWKVSHSIPVTK